VPWKWILVAEADIAPLQALVVGASLADSVIFMPAILSLALVGSTAGRSFWAETKLLLHRSLPWPHKAHVLSSGWAR
jgi:hypothetical protein